MKIRIWMRAISLVSGNAAYTTSIYNFQECFAKTTVRRHSWLVEISMKYRSRKSIMRQ